MNSSIYKVLGYYSWKPKYERRNDDLRLWIQTQHLFDALDKEIISDLMPSLFSVFGSNVDILKVLMQIAEPIKLQGIHDILKEEHRKQIEDSSTLIFNNKPKLLSSFDMISKESIEHICGYMEHRDITRFKNASRRISIICLEEMTKCEIKICSVNDLLDTHFRKLIIWNSSKYLKQYRYNKNTTYSELFQLIQKQKGIKLNHQIPFTMSTRWNYRPPGSGNRISYRTTLMVFDKTNITILETAKIREMNANDIYDFKHVLVILYYFDIESQSMQTIGVVMIEASMSANKIMDYIQNTLIPNNAQLRQLEYLLRTTDDTDNKLALYMVDSYRKTTKLTLGDDAYIFGCKDMWSGTYYRDAYACEPVPIIFQINPSSPEFTRQQEQYEIDNLKRMYLTADRFMDANDQIMFNIHVSYYREIDKLQSQIGHYFENKQLEKWTAFEDKGITLEISRNINRNILKEKIAMEYFGDVVDPENIEIYDRDQYSDNNGFYNDQSLLFKLVPYDANGHIPYQHSLYKMEIYLAADCPFPYNQNNTLTNLSSSNALQIDVVFNSVCTPEELLQHVVSEASHDLFFEEFEEIIKYNEDDEWDFEWFFVQDSYSPMLYVPFTDPAGIINRDQDTYKLFLIGSNCTDKYKKLRIFFVWENSFNVDMEHDEILNLLIGLPLTIWIDQNHTIESVMDNPYIRQYKNDIVSTYKIHFWTPELIKKNERSAYKIWEEYFDSDSEFILFTLRSELNVAPAHYTIQFNI